MELKHAYGIWHTKNGEAFNRTSMELKLIRKSSNISFEGSPFNRTSMELKHNKPRIIFTGLTLTFNRTSMELKRETNIRRWREEAFNRTSMELKRLTANRVLAILLLLIEPVWN